MQAAPTLAEGPLYFMDYSDEQIALCALNKIFGYHPTLALELIRKAGSALAVFAGDAPQLPSHPELFAQVNPAALDWAREELRRVADGGFRFLGLTDEDYPPLLRECPDPPLGLYLNGSSSPTEIFSLRPIVGVVGTRDLSPYGKAWARKLVEGLSRARVQPCIVSGLAIGADGIAHRTALDTGLPSIGVMATGIDAVYPWQHERLAIEMVRTPGCALVTDYPLRTAPVALNFIRRNRIIAGLARAVVVVESKSKGGSLMTARYATEYGRDVYALPGRADDLRSAGCNSLIRENMAEIITTPEDLAARLGLGAPVRGAGGSWAVSRGDEAAEKRLRQGLERSYGPEALPVRVGLAVRECRGISVEELAARLHLPLSEVLPAVALLETEGFLTTDLLRRCSLGPGWD